jgi:hypothetical protein
MTFSKLPLRPMFVLHKDALFHRQQNGEACQGTLTEREGSVQLTFSACFVKKKNIFLSIKSSLSKLVRARRSTVLILPPQ